eukprot:4497736-Pyramimonas_sp.AAC.1
MCIRDSPHRGGSRLGLVGAAADWAAHRQVDRQAEALEANWGDRDALEADVAEANRQLEADRGRAAKAEAEVAALRSATSAAEAEVAALKSA